MPDLFESLSPLLDVPDVDESVSNQDMDEPIGKSRVRPRAQGKVAGGPLGGRRTAGIGHEQLPAVSELGLEILHDRGHRFSRVTAHQENGARVRDISKRERQPSIEPERAHTSGGSGRHAKPAVVVDVGGSERHTGEFSKQVRLFVGQGAAAKDAHSITPIPLLHTLDATRDAIERFIPRRAHERVVIVAHERMQQTLRMVERCAG